jgi:drug/metabolite transporter (DMT)-like permease
MPFFAANPSALKKAFIQLHIAVFLAGFTGILGKLITLNEGLLVWWRLLLTSATMWLLFSFRKKLQPISTKDKLRVTGIGLIAALHWVTFYASIKYANVSVGLVCFSSVGFFTALFEPLLFRKKFIWIEVLLGVMVMGGIYIIFHFDPSYKTGIIIGIISAMLGAVFPMFNRRMVQRMNSETLLTYELTGGFLVLSAMLPFYLQQFPVSTILPGVSDLLWLLVLAWFCSVWAFQLSTNALKKIPTFTVNLTYNLEPVYGILLAFALYHENKYLQDTFYIGLGIILLAVVLQTWRVYRAARR